MVHRNWPFWNTFCTPNGLFRAPKYIFISLKCFKPVIGHIYNDIGPLSEFFSLNIPQRLNLAHSSPKLALFGPQIDFLEPQNIFF